MVGTKPIEIDGSYDFRIVSIDSTVGWIDGRRDMKCSSFADAVDIIIACNDDNNIDGWIKKYVAWQFKALSRLRKEVMMRGESDVPELQNRLHALLMAWIARGSVSSI